MSRFSTFCRALYRRGHPYKSKQAFVNAVLNHAGSNFPELDRSLADKLFDGLRPISDAVIESFPQRVLDATSTKRFILSCTRSSKPEQQESRLVDLLGSFQCPLELTRDQNLIALACVDYLESAIFQPSDSTSFYEFLSARMQSTSESRPMIPEPRYPGDRAQCSKPPATQRYAFSIWETFEHEWVIQNAGSVCWNNRTLTCLNPRSTELRPLTSTIPIPDVKPGEFVRIRGAFATRGKESTSTKSSWVMQDENGENCFPNRSSEFNVVVTIKFVLDEAENNI